MGIDAEILVRTMAKVTKADVNQWRYELGAAFGPGMFWIFKNDEDHSKSRHCMEIVKKYTQDGDDIEPKTGETFIRVYPGTRFYGIDYERGDLPFLIMLAEWLEKKIPDGEVWYGGDSSGVCAKKFDKPARRKLFDHFVKNGHFPYRGGFRSLLSNGGNGPSCPLCIFRLTQFGFGGDGHYAAYRCQGCGYKTTTRDGGKTWIIGEEKESVA